MADEYLLLKLNDETRKVAVEIVKDLPEGMAQIVTWADLEGIEAHQQTPEFLRLVQHEKLGYIPDPNYDEIPAAALETWYRKPRGKPRTLKPQRSGMSFFASKLGT